MTLFDFADENIICIYMTKCGNRSRQAIERERESEGEQGNNNKNSANPTY